MSAREPRVGDTVIGPAPFGQEQRVREVWTDNGRTYVTTGCEWFVSVFEWGPGWRVIDPPEDSGAGEGGL